VAKVCTSLPGLVDALLEASWLPWHLLGKAFGEFKINV
jgi:hypothetical protein